MIDSTLYHVDLAGDIVCKIMDKWLVIDGSYNVDLSKLPGGWVGHGYVMRHSQTKIFMLYREGI